MAALPLWPRADAHIHLFGRSFSQLPGVTSDDPVRYEAEAAKVGISAALIVAVGDASTNGLQGYGENNKFVADIAASGEFPWAKPTYYLRVFELSVLKLEEVAEAGNFVGITLYTGAHETEDGHPESSQLCAVDDEVWRWLDARKWIVSVNDACSGRVEAAKSGWGHWLNGECSSIAACRPLKRTLSALRICSRPETPDASAHVRPSWLAESAPIERHCHPS